MNNEEEEVIGGKIADNLSSSTYHYLPTSEIYINNDDDDDTDYNQNYNYKNYNEDSSRVLLHRAHESNRK